jgi:amino acid transporter
MKPTLGLTGVTMNAMALIAPGAFLWITYQVQMAGATPGGDSTALDMWPGIVFALVLAFLTALSYSELARIYPEAGTGSCYYFAEKAFVDKAEVRHHKWARLAKLVTGWAAHLFYWVYPGVMVAFMAILIQYIVNAITGIDIGAGGQIIVAVVFAAIVGFIAYRGVSGSTMTSIVINIIQLTALVGFSILAVAYRVMNPDGAQFVFAGPTDVVMPHNLMNVMFQATIAILILVGFESATAFGAEAKNPKRDVPRAVILALVVQGLFAYLIEYFAANFALANTTVALPDGVDAASAGADAVIAAAATSGAPIGDMVIRIGNAMLGGLGFGLMIVIAITVALAILGTTLSAISTGVRISYAMGQDSEMPEIFGVLHGEFATPHFAVIVLTIVSAIIGAIGTLSVVALTGITLASNLGTFVLYALTCLWAVIAFAGHPNFNALKHMVVPVLGLLANIAMLVTIFGVGILGGGTTQQEALIAIAFGVVWAVVSVIYVVAGNRRTGRSMMAVPPRPQIAS